MNDTLAKVKKISKRVGILIILIALLILSFFYFGVYGNGGRVGKVMKISEKGVVFKTYEGQINMEGFGAVKSDNMFSQTFEFSVEGNREDVINDLKKAMNDGNRVSIDYIERYWLIPWRGDSKYFVRDVTILED